MDAAHIHLLLNHIPVLGTIFATPLFAYALIRRSDELKRLSLVILFLTALITIPVYLSGEPAEEILENLSGISKPIVEQHEDSAKLSLAFVMLTGVLALVGMVLMRGRKEFARWCVLAALLSSAISAVLMARTANLGGQIRHTEIRPAGVTQQVPETQNRRGGDDDDR
jgi:uncharacterized membrane protein